MGENWTTVLPENVQKMVIAGLEEEVSERRALIQSEKQSSHPDGEAIASWQKDITASEKLRDNIF